jgi:tetratricopeptide (TPR) repeat protein
MDTAEERVKRGSRALNKGDLDSAIALFESVREELRRSDIEQQLGICYRLAGRVNDSAAAFDAALELSSSDFDTARILRDRGMLYLTLGDTEAAIRDFEQSCDLLQYRGDDASWSQDDRCTEYFVSLGFVGRAYLAIGEKPSARSQLQIADSALRGRVPYELNNIVWWMKAEHFGARLKLLPRALRLASQAKNHKRTAQVILTAISPQLAGKFSR